MSDRAEIARRALKAALELRRQVEAPRLLPVCVFDMAERLGVEVMFRGETSLEGMYVPGDPPRVLVSAVRPPGRQRYTCAHELGHHIFGHGTRVDELTDDRSSGGPKSEEEWLADIFAGYFLMPLPVVRESFASRGVSPSDATPEQIFAVASHLGVGYESLVSHLELSLGLLTSRHADALRRVSPKAIRAALVPDVQTRDLLVVDTLWRGRPVDIRVGDHILAPAIATTEGASVVACGGGSHRLLLCGVTPGLSRLEDPRSGWSVYIRVARHEYVGRSMFRHLRDPDANGQAADNR